MQASDWNSIFKLLGLIVMMDGKVYHEELKAFEDSALRLQEAISPDLFLTGNMAKDWFVNHRPFLADLVHSLDYDQAILEIIAPIKALKQKTMVLKAMIMIAKADGYYHNKERMIIEKTARYWNVTL